MRRRAISSCRAACSIRWNSTQQTYYDRYHFADVFASIKRAPDELINRIAKIPGVAIAERGSWCL